MMKKIRDATGVNISMLLSLIMLVVSGVLSIILFSLQMYLDGIIFFVFGVGTYWYVRLLRDKKPGIWYEIEDVEANTGVG